MGGAHKVDKALPQGFFVSLPCRIRSEHSDLVQLKPFCIVQVTFRYGRVVLKPMFSVSDGFRGLVVESPDAAQIFRDSTLRCQWDR
jgi:hypothetical protein